MRKLFLLFALLPALAFGQVLQRDTGTGTFATAPTFPGATSTGTIATKGLVSTALSTPVNATFTATTGTLNNGTYYYRVSALDAAGETLASTETSLTVSGGAASNGVVVNWGAVTGATSYKVYGRSTGAELYMATVTAPTVTWTDNGSVTPSGALPALGTSANISTVSGVTARDLTTTAASGANAISFSTSGARLDLGSGSSDYFYSDGTNIITPASCLKAQSFIASSNNGFQGVDGSAAVLRGRMSNDASAINARIGHGYTNLTNRAAKLLILDSGASSEARAQWWQDGSYQQLAIETLATCVSGLRGTVSFQRGGSAGKYDKYCTCVGDNQASEAYAWKNETGVFASEAASVGTNTTCPDP